MYDPEVEGYYGMESEDDDSLVDPRHLPMIEGVPMAEDSGDEGSQGRYVVPYENRALEPVYDRPPLRTRTYTTETRTPPKINNLCYSPSHHHMWHPVL